MEPPDEVFDTTHELFDAAGNAVQTSPTARAGTGGVLGRTLFRPHVHSVFLADGLHLEADPEDEMEELPRRFEGGSSKAKMTWFGALCLAGVGMFVEAYIIITTGQIKTIWHTAYPTCFEPGGTMPCPDNIQCCGLFENTPDTCGASDLCQDDKTYPDNLLCNEAVISAISYSEFAGIMLGMITFGKVADLLGKHVAGMLTSVFSLLGISMMTFYYNDNMNLQLLIFDIFFCIFGFGVGGEYPLTAASAAAHHIESMEDAVLDDKERRRIRVLREKERAVRRGETISLVFAMQGVGTVVGSTFVLCLLYFGNQLRVKCDAQHNSQGQSIEALNAIWRTFYFIGGIFVIMVLGYRGLVLEEGDGHKKLIARKERRKEMGHGNTTFNILKFYAPRLIGTGGCWFLVDIVFYGLKLFSGPIISAISPSNDLVTLNGYLLLNNVIALAGYYVAAYVIDMPKIGRKNLQMFSFLTCAILYLILQGIFETANPYLLLFLYFLSSFVANLMNTTSYVMAAETYPTELRATCHGISAFMGKAGALLATIIFADMTTPEIFIICGVVSIVGTLFTAFFSVDLTHVSLAEHDAQLELFLEGRAGDYKGRLNAKKHLSLYERLTGKHGEHDSEWAMSLLKKDMERALLGESGEEQD